VVRGVNNDIGGEGDGHQRGIGCLLTGAELFAGDLLGGGGTAAGWSRGISIDQEIANFLQADAATRTRFGSLVLGVLVPEKANTWTRLSYAGPNKPLTPIDDPYRLFDKLYGAREGRQKLASILDRVHADFAALGTKLSAEDRRTLDEHAEFVRGMERSLDVQRSEVDHVVPELEQGVRESFANTPKLFRMQNDLLAGALAADFARVATVQFSNSVGNVKMQWLGFGDSHHTLSHKPDRDDDAQKKLITINRYFAEEIARFVDRLASTPEPSGDGTLLDNTTVLWTNELGKGNTHTHKDVPFVLVGGGLGFKTGRSLDLGGVPHNRLLMSLAHAFGHRVETFGKASFCKGGTVGELGAA
ncbi:MAG: DUF1552 domain-containing protein, partial [Planctomycetota bacterium]